MNPAWTRRALLAGLLGPVGSAWAGEAEPPPPGPLYAVPTSKDRIGRVVAPVKVNGAGPFRFLIDTGANRSAISQTLAARLGLPVMAGAALVQGVTGAQTTAQVQIANLAADKLVWRNVAAAVIGPGVLDAADGILGADGFAGMRLSVDFVRDRINLAPAARGGPPKGYNVTQGRLIQRALLAAPARIGPVRATAVIDTGAERSIANSPLIAQLAAAGVATPVLLDTEILGVVGPALPARLLAMPPIALGELRVRQLNIAHLDAPIFRVWDLDAAPALLIGMDVLGQTAQLVIDYRSAALWFRFPPDPISTGSRIGAGSGATARTP